MKLADYDCENRLVDVDVGSSPRLHFEYDYLGRRVTKQLVWSGTATKFVYDGEQIIAEYDVCTGWLLRKYVYGPGIDEPICMIDESSRHYYHYDGLGSVVALTDDNGAVVEKYRYDAFGTPTILSANNEQRGASWYFNRFMFTGREYDKESGLYYYRARMYHPQLGRFLQTDPIGYYDSMNLYQYCGNNPINFVDPTGKFWGLVGGGAIGGIIGAAGGFGGYLGNLAAGGEFSWGGLGVAVGQGALAGAIVGAVAGAITGDPAAVAFAGSVLGTAGTTYAGSFVGGYVFGGGGSTSSGSGGSGTSGNGGSSGGGGAGSGGGTGGRGCR